MSSPLRLGLLLLPLSMFPDVVGLKPRKKYIEAFSK